MVAPEDEGLDSLRSAGVDIPNAAVESAVQRLARMPVQTFVTEARTTLEIGSGLRQSISGTVFLAFISYILYLVFGT